MDGRPVRKDNKNEIRLIFKKTILTVSIFFIFTILQLDSSVLLDISGDYLFYSYDYNYIYGRGNIVIKGGDYELSGTSLEINIRNRSLLLTSSCKVISENKNVTKGDMVRSDLNKMSITIYNFGETIRVNSLKGGKPSGVFVRRRKKLLEESLLYFVGRKFLIRDNFEITGFGVTVFIEGVQSVSFKKFRMDKGISGKRDRFSINKLWYTNKSGLITDISFNYKKNSRKTKFSNKEFFKLNYDLFKVISDSPEPEINIGSETVFNLASGSSLMIKGGYITGNSGNALLTWNSAKMKRVSTSLTLDYRDRINGNPELWLRGRLGIDLKKGGNLNLKYNHEKNLGYSGDMTYNNEIGKHFSFSATSSLSGIKVSGLILNKISDTNLSLNYTNNVFTVSGNYSLNRDLIKNNYRYSPGFRINIRPLGFYGGLLRMNFSSSLQFTKTIREDTNENTFRSNTTLSVSGKHLDISKGLFIDVSGRIEQFFDKDPMENFTTAGIVLRGVRRISDGSSFEISYNFHTRRETRDWLIAGTSTGELSAMLRLGSLGEKLNFVGSVSYDIETGDYTTGFFNLKYNLIKHWDFHTLFNYDFEFKKMNYSIFLERQAGRILLRASFRSLSKQFQLEVIPR